MTALDDRARATLDPHDANGVLACQSEVLELIATGAALPVMLGPITTAIERLMPGSRCSILLLDPDSGTLRHGSAPSLPPDYLAAIDGLAPGPDVGSCGAAAFHVQPVVVADIETDARWADFRVAARAAGLRACWSTPIVGNEATAIGTFAVYHGDVHAPTEREREVVARLSYLASVAIEQAATVRALSESEERFRRAFEDNVVGMALLDTAGRFTRANDALRALTGDSPVVAAGAGLADLVEPAERARVDAAVRDVAGGRRGSALFETRLQRPDGTAAAVSTTVSLIRGARGEPLQLSVTMLDITERLAAQEERRARHEAEVARRTAEAASRAKSRFLSTVSHEMRTPLQAINGFVELLGTLDLDESRRRQALGHITEGTGHLLALVDDTLDLARIEADALPLQREPVALADVLADVVDFLAPVADLRAVRLDRGPASGVVLADRRRLRQVVINLVSNGIRYSGRDGVVRVGSQCHDSGTAHLTVTDNGPGIPSHLRARLFEPFTRLDDTRADDGSPEGVSGEGIGLGLMLARGLTEAMGGRLTLAGGEAGGTVAEVALPAAPSRTIGRDDRSHRPSSAPAR